jgi:hypothetical protein
MTEKIFNRSQAGQIFFLSGGAFFSSAKGFQFFVKKCFVNQVYKQWF